MSHRSNPRHSFITNCIHFSKDWCYVPCACVIAEIPIKMATMMLKLIHDMSHGHVFCCRNSNQYCCGDAASILRLLKAVCSAAVAQLAMLEPQAVICCLNLATVHSLLNYVAKFMKVCDAKAKCMCLNLVIIHSND